MQGLDMRVKRLLGSRFLLLGAIDHGQYLGVPEGLSRPLEFLGKIQSSDIDGMIINPGIARRIESFPPHKSIVLRVTHAGTHLSGNHWDNRFYLPAEQALLLGCDVAIAMCILGHEQDSQALHELALTVTEYHRFGIPVMAEMLPFDPKQGTASEVIASISRIGAEIGADIIKTAYVPGFDKVVSGCPVPVIMAGGETSGSFLDNVRAAVKGGARGLAMGRNLFQSLTPENLIKDIRGIIEEERP